MKKRRKKHRRWKLRGPRPTCCPCLGMLTITLDLCHFYTDLECVCCNARSARPDGRDLKLHLKLLPKSPKARMGQFRFQALQALDAEVAANWTDAIIRYEACRQTLAAMEDRLPMSLHLWLLMWTSTPLISLYHLKSQKFSKSIEIAEMLMNWLQVRMRKLLQCWEVSNNRVKSHFRCRALLSRLSREFLVAHDVLERDRRLVYYEWSTNYSAGADFEELRGKALEGFEYREDSLCHWLSKAHLQYGDYGRAQH